MGPGSDVDLLAVYPDGIHRRRTAQDAYRSQTGLGIAKDMVVATESDVLNYGDNPSADFILIHNPMAKKNKIPHQWLKCGREGWVEGGRLVIKDWYKEHPSYAKATEAEVTLEEHIQKDNARRRVGEE